MFRNESGYPNANTFNPDRFLKDGQIDPNVKDLGLQAFGWGRGYFHSKRLIIRPLNDV